MSDTLADESVKEESDIFSALKELIILLKRKMQVHL